MTAVLPPARVAIAGNAPPSREWYRYFQAATQVNLDVGTLRHDVDALTVRVTALEDASPSGGDTKITGAGSIYVSATAVKVVSLNGDVEDPGFTAYYGTDATGEKGWYAVGDALASSDNIAKSTDAAGVTSFDLVDLTDSGTGAALVKTTRDSKGRISGTSAATTTDLAEGDNLYFTNARAQAAVVSASITDGDTTHSPSGDTVHDALVGKEPAITAGTAAQYWRGDKSWQTLDKAAVGLGNVDNTSDADKPVSTAQAAADALAMPKTGGTFTGDIAATNLKPNLTVTDWNSYDTNVGAFFPSCVSGSANGPGTNFYSGLRVFRTSAGSGAELAMRESASSAELWFRGWSGGSQSGWKQAATTDQIAADSGWQTISPQNGWSNSGSPYATCACRKLGSFVTLRGAIGGGTLTNGTTVCTIPSGYRPPSDLQFAISSTSTDPTARMIVRSSGAVQIYGVNAASVALDGTSYFVD